MNQTDARTRHMDHSCNGRCGEGLHCTLERLPSGTPLPEADVVLRWSYRVRARTVIRVESATMPAPEPAMTGSPFHVWWVAARQAP